jgi:hypothetical protein
MKYSITVKHNRSYVESVILGFIAPVISIILLPFAVLMLAAFIVIFPIAGLLGFVGIEQK